MLLNNYLLYRLTAPLELTQEALETALATKLARPCGSQDLSTYGFVSPYEMKESERKETSPALSMWGQNCVMIAARHEEKKLSGTVVRDEVDTRVKAIEDAELRKVYKKERDTIKDQVVLEFLPRAFIGRSFTQAYIDLDKQLIVVGAASHKKAEDLLSTLREVLGSLPVRPLTVKLSPSATLTDWIKNKEAAEGFFVLDCCTLKDTHEDGGTVTCKHQDLASDEVLTLIAAGKVVTKLSLAYQDKLSFTIDDKLVLTKVKFEDLLVDDANAKGGEEKNGQREASFIMMVETNRLLIDSLLPALGGEDVPQGI